MAIKRVVLYARLSVTTEESVSIARQLESARKYAEARRWTVVGQYRDDGVSASKVKPENRTGWRDLVNSAEAFDAVVVWKIDRLARRVLDFLHADEVLRQRGAGIVAVEDPVDMTTPQGRAFATMLAVFGEMEAAAISARVKAARRALLENGRRAGGRPPFGWMNVPNHDGPGMVLAQDPDRISYVTEAARRALKGDSLYSITRWLDESGAPRREHKGRKSTYWAEASVEAILRNPVLAGMTPYAPGRKPGEKPRHTDVVRDRDGLPVIDESVAILSTSDYRRLLALLDAAKKPGSRAKASQNPALLSSLCRCGTCSGVMHRARAGGRYESYRCSNRACERKAGINLPNLEMYVSTRVLEVKGSALVVEWETTVQDDNPALVEIDSALKDASLAMLDDSADVSALAERITALKERREAVRRQADRLPLTVHHWLDQTYADAWASAETIAERRKLLLGQIRGVVIQPGDKARNRFDPSRVEIIWRPQPEPTEMIIEPVGMFAHLTEPLHLNPQ